MTRLILTDISTCHNHKKFIIIKVKCFKYLCTSCRILLWFQCKKNNLNRSRHSVIISKKLFLEKKKGYWIASDTRFCSYCSTVLYSLRPTLIVQFPNMAYGVNWLFSSVLYHYNRSQLNSKWTPYLETRQLMLDRGSIH